MEQQLRHWPNAVRWSRVTGIRSNVVRYGNETGAMVRLIKASITYGTPRIALCVS